MKKLFTIAVIAMVMMAKPVMAQTNIQVFYDLGKDREHATTTLEGFYGDKWGNTYFFVDHDFKSKGSDGKHTHAPSGTYAEIARCLNFWQNTALSPLSLQVEYNGGVYKNYTINNAWLFGVDYFIHSKDFKNTLNLKALYKTIESTDQEVPMQFTVVWGMKDLFGVKGLQFTGFADFWWENHTVFAYRNGAYDDADRKTAHTVFITEPQVWYQVGQHFGVDNLNIGGEVEISNNFATGKDLWVRPCLGVKWQF
jgi:hypothetical protein